MSELARRLQSAGPSRSMSEEELIFGANPIDKLRGSINTGSIPSGNPQGRETLAHALLSITPGPGNVISANDAYNSAGDAYSAFKGGDYKGGALATALTALSGAGAVLGLPFGKFAKGAADAGKDTLNIFAGPTAKTADHAALGRAREMKAAGASRDDIWLQEGWDLDKADGVPRFEIDDSGAQLAGVDTAGTSFSGMNHPELVAAYGETPGIYGSIDKSKPMSGAHMVDPTGQGRPPYITAQGPDLEAAKSVGLHELQHNAQSMEGFASGGNWRDVLQTPEAKAAVAARFQQMKASGANLADEDIFANAEVSVARDMYNRLAGEVEARNVQSRMNMSAAERRAKAPWLTQDVPDDQQIVRFR